MEHKGKFQVYQSLEAVGNIHGIGQLLNCFKGKSHIILTRTGHILDIAESVKGSLVTVVVIERLFLPHLRTSQHIGQAAVDIFRHSAHHKHRIGNGRGGIHLNGGQLVHRAARLVCGNAESKVKILAAGAVILGTEHNVGIALINKSYL